MTREELIEQTAQAIVDAYDLKTLMQVAIEVVENNLRGMPTQDILIEAEESGLEIEVEIQ